MKVRPGIVFSSTAHAALLAYAIVSIGSAKPFETAPTEALPIEILSPEQFDAMTKGSKASKKVEAPKQKVDKVAAVDAQPVDDDLKVAKEDVKAPPPAPSAEAETPPLPDPAVAKAKAEAEKAAAAKAAAVKAEAAAKAEAAKAAQEKVAQEKAAKAEAEKAAQAKAAEAKANAEKAEKLAQAAEAERVAKAEAQKAAQEKAAAEKAAAEKTAQEKAEAEKAAKLAAEKAAKEKAEKLAKAEAEKAAKAAKEKAEAEKAKAAARKFDLASIEKMLDSKTSSRSDSALHDVREPSRKAAEGRETAPETTAGTDRGTSLSPAQRSAIGNAIISQVSPCWSPPVGATADSGLVVTVKFQLSSDGSLIGTPTVVNSSSNPAFRAAAGAAMRAIQRCAPIKLPAESYDYWRQVNINFDPKDLMGG